MSDAPARARASTAKRGKATQSKRAGALSAEAILKAEFEAMMERSGKKLDKLNADLDQMLLRLDGSRLKT